eukprot:CAMPEP_0197661718 /NCGR_PEP_ID=MMETSP1338-20131121/51624_1 /TAXON_ID=43686 ORGANISM="Pelagodinium beii, Strain RCC1491" /NCGR_SAMPLE_ID=MMETSP1338 /ASSEMBLY_ACC=CAM_ASM_000754 /LENGTH=527 /DNA_ID=CAMNT_0043239325 /DNA_START=70 /DNA_END=1651 /DNA_ORIENTATION=-
MMSEIGRSSSRELNALRKQLGPGVDPAFDYKAMREAEKSHASQQASANAKDPSSPTGASTGLDQLRRALRDVVGDKATLEEPDANEAEETNQSVAGTKAMGLMRAQREQKRPNAAFLSTTREYQASLDLENRFRAPPPGSYRPNGALSDPRVLGQVDMSKGLEPTKSRTNLVLEKQVMKLQAEGKPYEHLLKGVKSTELLDEKPERIGPRILVPDMDNYSVRPDMQKSSKINFQDNSFTDHVLDGDYATSSLLRSPKWDFAKLSVSEPKLRDTFFQPGQYKPNLDAVRTTLEKKNPHFENYQARKPLRETVGRTEIKKRAGDHLPDRSLTRFSTTCLSTRSRLLSPDFENYSERPSILPKGKKPWHDTSDPEVDKAVLNYQMTFNIMDAEKARWKPSKTVQDFNKDLTRQQQLKILRSYGQDVAMQRAKDNVTRGPVSVELLTDVDKSTQLQPRLKTQGFIHMDGREPEHRYVMSPARQKDQPAKTFHRDIRVGESRVDSFGLSPLAGAISELRNTREYDALGQTIK